MEHTDVNLYPTAVLLSSLEDEWLQNPAFRFFGKRLITEQSLPEFLNELLLILFSSKRLANTPHTPFESCFPPREILAMRGGHCLEYTPSAHLNLKLFAFFGASRLDARHKMHRDHFESLQHWLYSRIQTESDQDKSIIIRDLEKLFLGLRSVGDGRTWCAQQFLPLCQNLLRACLETHLSIMKRFNSMLAMAI